MVREEARREGAGNDFTSQDYRDWARSSRPPFADLLRVGIFAPHAASSQSAILADWAVAAGSRLLPALRGDRPNVVSPPHGEKAVGVAGHGRQVLRGRTPGAGRRRRYADRHGARVGHRTGNRRAGRRRLAADPGRASQDAPCCHSHSGHDSKRRGCSADNASGDNVALYHSGGG
jgi:hypothetical protein